MTFADAERAGKRKQTRKELFLIEMEQVVPWQGLIAAAPSTKNKAKARDPEMRQTRKGKQWYFGMKAPLGVDAHTGLVQTVKGTAANEGDVAPAHELLHGQERAAFADAGYQSVDKRQENVAGRGLACGDEAQRTRGAADNAPGRLRERTERLKAKIRAKVEHPSHVIKNRFGHCKVRYRGLAKNEAQLFPLFGQANLLLAQRQWRRPQGGAPRGRAMGPGRG